MTDPLHSNHHANLVSLWKHNPIKQKSTLVKYLVLKLFPPFPSCPPSHKEHLHSPTVTQALRRCTSELVYNVAVPGFSGKFLTMITLPPKEVSACRNLPFEYHLPSYCTHNRTWNWNSLVNAYIFILAKVSWSLVLNWKINKLISAMKTHNFI